MDAKTCNHKPVHRNARCYPYKRLIVCCDGTWQASNQGTRSVPSNIAKLSRSIKASGPADKDGNGVCPQITYYDAGVGTAMGWLDKKYSGAFGEGLSENVCEAYNFLVNNFEEGDEVYIFGFSRGGYTARALAGLVAIVGICRNDMMDSFWEMYEAYCSKGPDVKLEDTPWGQSGLDYRGAKGQKGNGKEWLKNCYKEINIKVVGVFDTVGSLGWPDSALVNLTNKNENQKYGFHDTNIHPSIKNAFHAMALDEKRRPFAPTLWYLPERSETNLIQCWFPGVHINIGGGSDDSLKEIQQSKGDLESMANITFAWMVDRVREVSLLSFEMGFMFRIMDSYAENLQKLITRKHDASWTNWNNSAEPKVYRGWGVGPIHDSFDSQDVVTRNISGSRVRTPGEYFLVGKNKTSTVLTPEKTKEYIHPVVFHSRGWRTPPAGEQNYSPASLAGFTRHGLPNPAGYVYYEKEITPSTPPQGWLEWASSPFRSKSSPPPSPPAPVRTIRIPEFRIPYETEYVEFECLERKLVQAKPAEEIRQSDERKDLNKDRAGAVDFLIELDRSNLEDWAVREKLKSRALVRVEEKYVNGEKLVYPA